MPYCLWAEACRPCSRAFRQRSEKTLLPLHRHPHGNHQGKASHLLPVLRTVPVQPGHQEHPVPALLGPGQIQRQGSGKNGSGGDPPALRESIDLSAQLFRQFVNIAVPSVSRRGSRQDAAFKLRVPKIFQPEGPLLLLLHRFLRTGLPKRQILQALSSQGVQDPLGSLAHAEAVQ